MKFDALFQDLLEATQKSSKGELPYKSDADGDLVWTRRGGNLEGAPKEVMGGFYCANNQLVSLEGAPKTVGGSFVCFANHLKDLKGAPEKVGRDFSCNDNFIESLEGAPKEVGRDFFCSGNLLQNLEGAPEVIRGRVFACTRNPLTSLRGIPNAETYSLPEGFTEKDASKELRRRKFESNLDSETLSTFGDFVSEL